jgi:tetratricopeptide (TPR) repeat protein
MASSILGKLGIGRKREGAPATGPQSTDVISLYLARAKANPNDVQAHFNLGSAYFVQGKLGEALQELRAVLAVAPEHYDAHYHLGLVYAQLGDLEQASRELRLVIEGSPNQMLKDYAKRKLAALGG